MCDEPSFKFLALRNTQRLRFGIAPANRFPRRRMRTYGSCSIVLLTEDAAITPELRELANLDVTVTSTVGPAQLGQQGPALWTYKNDHQWITTVGLLAVRIQVSEL